jgi:hypothetical protein
MFIILGFKDSEDGNAFEAGLKTQTSMESLMHIDVQERLLRWAKNKDRRTPKAFVGAAFIAFIGLSLIRALSLGWARMVLTSLIKAPDAILRRLGGRRGFFIEECPDSSPELDISWKAFSKKTG